ncbi:MAG: hypothetical protein DKINENOH_01268 [bacterium]|nr:hypothetical protein [bacterium]
MHFELLRHTWQAAVRSVLWYRNLATTVFLCAILLLLILNLLSLGLFIDQLFLRLLPGRDPVTAGSGLLVYYFLIDLAMRAILQRVPGLEIRPYLPLPVPRLRLIHHLLVRSALSLFNFLPLLVLAPFALKIILPQHGSVPALAWLFAAWGLIMSASFLHVFLDRQHLAKPHRVLAVGVFFLLCLAADRLKVVSLADISSAFFQLILTHPGATVLPWGMVALLYFFNVNTLRRHLYLDQLPASGARPRRMAGSLAWLERRGEIGCFLALELKLLWRHKRARSSFSLVLITAAIMPLFYPTIKDQLEFYPLPSEPPASLVAVPVSSAEERLVTFRVISNPAQAKSHVYLTGDHVRLGKWQPAFLPLQQQPDSTWSRAVAFEAGATVRYIFTLGSWENEAGMGGGPEPEVHSFVVRGDTTLTHAHPRWKTPHRLIPVDVMIIYMGLLVTGIAMLIYGQFVFSWESGFFDLLLSRPLQLLQYLRAKFVLLLAFTVPLFLLSLLLGFYSKQLLWLNSALFLYNLGVNAVVLLAWATFSRKRLDLNASIFSTQGKGSSQFIVILPTLIVPILLYLPFALAHHADLGFVFLASLGGLGLLFQSVALRGIARLFLRQKYQMAAGFREL